MANLFPEPREMEAGELTTDPTTAPDLKTFIEVASESHFPIQNLPFGVFNRRNHVGLRAGVRIGDHVLDLQVLQERGFGTEAPLRKGMFAQPNLNSFLEQGRSAWRAARELISNLLNADTPTLRDDSELRSQAIAPIAEIDMALPLAIGDYTDFYSSREHATNVGIMFRGKENALMPNWLHLPVAYHGRASSIVVSGTDVRRPRGQVMPEGAKQPVYSPSHLLDFELEMGFFTGFGNELGHPIPITSAHDHIFGMVLVNDWSARDIQKWEYQPLGPFNAKNFATSISPWIVTLDALEPFRCPGPAQEPEPLEYLRGAGDRAYDIELEVWLQSQKMKNPARICRSNFKHLYWNICQQLAHHTVTGCNVRPGDMMASGTISAPAPDGYGSMLELSWKGTKPLIFADGEQRKFLADGDTVTITGFCRGEGYRVGFGQVSGMILPAEG
jgi:fumarylacetoacetase